MPSRSDKRYPDDGVVPLALDLDTIGSMGRTVEDVALLDTAIGGGAPLPPRPLRGLRIGVPYGAPFWSPLDRDVATVAEAALARLTDRGVQLVPIDLTGIARRAFELFWILIVAGNKLDLSAYIERREPRIDFDAFLATIRSADVRLSLTQSWKTRLDEAALDGARGDRRTRLRADYVALLDQHGLDAVIYPTEPVIPPPIAAGGDRPDSRIMVGGVSASQAETLVRNTVPSCVIGAPGLSLPCGVTSEGLPVGLSIEARPGEDRKLLATGLAIEGVFGSIHI